MPLRLGITRTQSRAGSWGSGTSPSFSIERALVATSARPPAAFTTAKAGIDLAYVNASTPLPSRRLRRRPPHRVGRGTLPATLPASPSYCLQVFGGAGVWHREAPVARGHAPALDAPAALARHLRQPRVWIHGHGRADELEHRQVGQRVGVGEALCKRDPIARCVLLEQR